MAYHYHGSTHAIFRTLRNGGTLHGHTVEMIPLIYEEQVHHPNDHQDNGAPKYYTVIRDTSPDPLWSRGAKFETVQFLATMHKGYFDGVIFQRPKGQIVIVKHHRMEKYNG